MTTNVLQRAFYLINIAVAACAIYLFIQLESSIQTRFNNRTMIIISRNWLDENYNVNPLYNGNNIYRDTLSEVDSAKVYHGGLDTESEDCFRDVRINPAAEIID